MIERSPRIAIVSDPLVQRGGAERVVQSLAELYAEAPIFAILYSALRGPANIRARVRESWLGRLPGAAHRHRVYLPLYPSAVESFNLEPYDIIISSHHTAAKGLIRGSRQFHISYCHTPMRALWERTHEELQTLPRALRPLAALLLSRLRVWDYASAGRVDHFLANSRATQLRIAKHYGRTSEIVHPPIDTRRFTPGGEVGDYYFVASRPVPYKRIDIAIAAATRLNRRVIIAGGGAPPAGFRGNNVEVRGHVSDAELTTLMRGARALLFPQLEDFGMTPLEANACGRPVIAFGAGGALETVVPGRTGVFADAQNVDAFASAIQRFEELDFNPIEIRAHAERFSQERFKERIASVVARAWSEQDGKVAGGEMVFDRRKVVA